MSIQRGTPCEKVITVSACTRAQGCAPYINNLESNKIKVDVEPAWPEPTQFKDQPHLLLLAAGVAAVTLLHSADHDVIQRMGI